MTQRNEERSRKRPRLSMPLEATAELQGGRWYGPERPADSVDADARADRAYEQDLRRQSRFDDLRRRVEARIEPWRGGWSYPSSPSSSGSDDEDLPDELDPRPSALVVTTRQMIANGFRARLGIARAVVDEPGSGRQHDWASWRISTATRCEAAGSRTAGGTRGGGVYE